MTPGEGKPPSLRKALESALVADPDDRTAHSAYADYLMEQGDPRGEFIQVQLALEDPSLSAARQGRLRARERELLEAHAREWLGGLAPFLLDHRQDDLPDWWPVEGDERGAYTFARGWVDTLEVTCLTGEMAKVVAKAPELRLLRRLVLNEVEDYEGPLETLGKSRHLRNVRSLVVDGYAALEVEDLVEALPRLEEISLQASFNILGGLFSLRTLGSLRSLEVHGGDDFPLDALASNPSLARLARLSLHPRARQAGDEHAYIRLKDVRALVRSKHLKALTHLTIRLSDMGDAGCCEFVSSGILRRLKVLELGPGCITDEGARVLAGCPDLKHLELLDLSGNRLTPAGVRALEDSGVKLIARDQQEPVGGEYSDDYLLDGDLE